LEEIEMGNVFKISDEDQVIAATSSSQLAAIIGKEDTANIRIV
jgi:hypothetical protein